MRDSNKNQRRVSHAFLTPVDPNPDAIPCNTGQSREYETAYLCGICNPVQRPATTDRTLVAGAGQRFESARRLHLASTDGSHNRPLLPWLWRRDLLAATPAATRAIRSGIRRGTSAVQVHKKYSFAGHFDI